MIFFFVGPTVATAFLDQGQNPIYKTRGEHARARWEKASVT